MDVREKLSSEKRLIDANALKSYMDECSKETRFRVYYGYATSFIDAAPTVDAVGVVRSRECVGRPFWEEDHNGVPVCLLSGLYVRSEDDFCSYGERKDGDEG